MLAGRYVALPMQMRWSEAGGLANAQDEYQHAGPIGRDFRAAGANRASMTA